jgi:hypothetical protein
LRFWVGVLPKSCGYARRKSVRASGHAADVLLIRRESCDFPPELLARLRFMYHGAGARRGSKPEGGRLKADSEKRHYGT